MAVMVCLPSLLALASCSRIARLGRYGYFLPLEDLTTSMQRPVRRLVSVEIAGRVGLCHPPTRHPPLLRFFQAPEGTASEEGGNTNGGQYT